MKRLIIDNLKKTGSLFGIIGLIGGTVSDILQPLFPFVSYIFFFTSITSILLFLTLFLAKSLQTKIIPAFLCSFFIMFFSGIFYFFQGEQKQEKGFLAETIPLISSLQSSIGLLQDDISQIKKTTENIEETTEQIVTKLDEIQKEFSEINKSNGIIDNPTKPEQFYHNARIQELGGDYINARKSYNSYFAFKLDFIDPHLRYQTFLKIQEGRAGAREIYSGIYERDPRPIVEFARILLFDPPKRIDMLKKFIANNPDFAPSYYELSREYSQARKGMQSLSDKTEELKYLEKFMLLKNEGKLFKYFVDKDTVSKWVDDAEERLKSLSIVLETLSKPTVKISATSASSSKYTSKWTVKINISEFARKISYSIDSNTNFVSTGMTNSIDLETGVQKPVFTFSLPGSTKNAAIFVKYLDINSIEKGPYKIEFDALIESIKEVENIRPDNWIEYTVPLVTFGGPVVVADLSRLIKMRCGISKIFYGVDRPDTNWHIPLEKCRYNNTDELSFHEDQASKISAGGAGANYARFVVIKLQYRDGKTSKIYKFPSPYAHLYEEP